MIKSNSMNTILLQPESFELHVYSTEWKTPWYQLDTESCLLSSFIPCHIHSKVLSIHSRSSYKYYFLTILLLYSFYYTTIIGLIYMPSLICKGEQTETCMYQSHDSCNELYMITNYDKTYQCKWVNFIDACIPETNQQCIQKEINNGNMSVIYVSFSIFTIVYWFVKFKFRESFQGNNNIPRKKWGDCFLSIFCPICSDAQIYREETIKFESFVTV